MIKRFTDNAANERTYLAWIRTAIAIMAFGFLVEKFDFIVHKVLVENVNADNISYKWIGISLMVFAILIIIVASIRFIRNKKHISDEKELNIKYSLSIVLIGLFLFSMSIILTIYVVMTTFRL